MRLLALTFIVLTLVPVADAARPRPARPIVIAHRGASAYRPEHTLEAYRLAVEMGADFIESDVVATKDGHLVARHENEVSETTDVAARPEFASRRATKRIDGETVTGWFTEDFTLAELKTLRCKERLPQLRPQSAAHDGRYQIPTLQEVIDLARGMVRGRGRPVGLYPETKHPTYFRSIGLPLEERLVALLHRSGYRSRSAPVFIQSFEVGNLKSLRKRTRLRLIQLIGDTGRPYDFDAAGEARTYADMITPAGLAEIAAYADGIGPAKSLIVPRDRDDRLLPPTSLVADAHAAGLIVHPYTFRSHNQFLAADHRVQPVSTRFDPALEGDAAAEYRLFFNLCVDGLFSDNPDTAVATRAALTRRDGCRRVTPRFRAQRLR